MTKGTRIDGDDDACCAQAVRELAPSSQSAAPASHVISFPRRDTAASVPAAGGDPPSSPAPFEPIGPILHAVVMRIKDQRVRIHVQRAAREEDNGPLS